MNDLNSELRKKVMFCIGLIITIIVLSLILFNNA